MEFAETGAEDLAGRNRREHRPPFHQPPARPDRNHARGRRIAELI
jgi:hypothetical protein